jgi:hypothetical protein
MIKIAMSFNKKSSQWKTIAIFYPDQKIKKFTTFTIFNWRFLFIFYAMLG